MYGNFNIVIIKLNIFNLYMIRKFFYKKNQNTDLIIDIVSDEGSFLSILDYGCGAGDLLKLLRENKFNAFGCDIFLNPELDNAKKMNSKFEIPYATNKFDYIVSNQVIEHVHNIDIMIREFSRVLKKNGKALLIFPTFETFIEWHLKVPIIHWFNKFHLIQKLLLNFFSFFKSESIKELSMTRADWVNDRFYFLQNYTKYRTRLNIVKKFSDNGFKISSIEQEFFYKKYYIKPIFKLFLNRYTFPYILGSVFLIKKN